MGKIFGEPGKIICIKPRHSFNPFASIPEYRFLKPQEHFSYSGEKPEIITISDSPLNVELKRKEIKTADNAVIDVGIELTAKPKIDKINKDQIFKILQAFEKRDEKTKEWLENILAPMTNRLEDFFLEDIYGDNSQVNRDQNEAITFKIEQWANDLIDEYNFVVVKRSCRLILPPIRERKDLKSENPNDQPMIAYINKHSKIRKDLIDAERNHKKDLIDAEKKHEEALKILENSYTEKIMKLQMVSKEAELKHKKDMEEKQNEIEAGIEEIKKSFAIKKEKIESKSSIEINEIKKENASKILKTNVEIDERNAELHEKQNKFELRKIHNESEKEKEKQKIEMNCKNEVEQEELRLIIEGIKKESQYSDILNSQQVSIKEMLEENKLKFKNKLFKLEKEINDIKREEEYEKASKQMDLKMKPEQLRHRHQMEQKRLNALALIVSYAIQAEEKYRIVDNLGDSIPKMMEALNGMITDLKIVNVPNGENGKSMFGNIREIYNFMTASSMFTPLFSDLIQEFRRSCFNQEGEDSDNSDRDFSQG